MIENSPTVFSATVLPPALGPESKRMVSSSDKSIFRGTTFLWANSRIGFRASFKIKLFCSEKRGAKLLVCFAKRARV